VLASHNSRLIAGVAPEGGALVRFQLETATAHA
jgi:hypothetical protein